MSGAPRGGANRGDSLFRGRFLELRRRGSWEYVQRRRSSGVVAVLAVTDDSEILLCEQYRPPVDAPVLEPPAGLVGDEEGREREPLEEAARRELEEETGYRAGELELLFAGPSSAGLSSETIHFYRARSLERVGSGGGDHSEDITVHQVPLAEAAAFVWNKIEAGVLVDPKVFALLYLAPPQNF